MITFLKNPDKMTDRELRQELKATREIIDDVYNVIGDSTTERCRTAAGKQNLINQVARYCCREMPK